MEDRNIRDRVPGGANALLRERERGGRGRRSSKESADESEHVGLSGMPCGSVGRTVPRDEPPWVFTVYKKARDILIITHNTKIALAVNMNGFKCAPEPRTLTCTQ